MIASGHECATPAIKPEVRCWLTSAACQRRHSFLGLNLTSPAPTCARRRPTGCRSRLATHPKGKVGIAARNRNFRLASEIGFVLENAASIEGSNDEDELSQVDDNGRSFCRQQHSRHSVARPENVQCPTSPRLTTDPNNFGRAARGFVPANYTDRLKNNIFGRIRLCLAAGIRLFSTQDSIIITIYL